MAANRLSGEEIEELKEQATVPSWARVGPAGDMSDETGIKVVTNANGIWVEDAGGKQWLDTIAGMWLKNVGHGRKEIAQAAYQQMQEISFSPGGTVSPATIRLSAKIASLAPDKESRVYFVSGGSEGGGDCVEDGKKLLQEQG